MDGILASCPAVEVNSESTIDAVFEPLGWHGKDIRLVTLHPADSEYNLIVCTLECASLLDDGGGGDGDETAALPRYEALSWAWGDASKTDIILLQGEWWQAPQNLVEALRALRRPSTPRKLWVDALCISQSRASSSALHERGHQVSLMKSVYARADTVIVWLGEARPWTGEFFASLRLLSKKCPAHSVAEACDLIERHGRDERTKNLTFVDWLWDLVTRPWWRRLWVLQEFALARSAVVACDAHLIDFDDVLNAFSIIRRVSKKLSNSRIDSQRFVSWSAYTSMVEDVRRYGLGTLPQEWLLLESTCKHPQVRETYAFLQFSYLLAGCRFQLASDPRDMIYGIVGLTTDAVSQQIRPRYDISTEDVFTQTTLKLIHKTGTLFMLSQAQIAMWKPPPKATHTSIPLSELPSWVPDWSLKRREFGYSAETRCRSRTERERLFTACGDSVAKISLIKERVLRVQGIHIDEVSKLHRVWQLAGSEYIPNLEFLRVWTETKNPRVAERRADPANSTGSGIETATSYSYIGNSRKIDAFWKTWVHDIQPTDDLAEVRRCDAAFIPICEQWRKAYLMDDGSTNSVAQFPFRDLISFTTFINIRLILTADGFLGLGNTMIEPGDAVYVLAGGTHPFVLRRSANNPGYYRIVAEIYVHGLMDGEALTEVYGSSKRRRSSQALTPDMPISNSLRDIWEDILLE